MPILPILTFAIGVLKFLRGFAKCCWELCILNKVSFQLVGISQAFYSWSGPFRLALSYKVDNDTVSSVY